MRRRGRRDKRRIQEPTYCPEGCARQLSKSLVIVESPAKARTIEKFLGRRYAVKASMGHVRDLPRSQFGVDVEAGFEPKYITIRGKGEVLRELRESARRALESSGNVYLATDPDREGEAISWHLAEVLGLPSDRVHRVEFYEITREAVRRALRAPRPIDDARVKAQQARRILDRLVGYKLSPLLWRKVRRGLSAGRVQSVALRLICDREDEIKAFQPREYWTIQAAFESGGEAVAARWHGEGAAGAEGEPLARGELPDRAAVDAVLARLEGASFWVEAVRRQQRRRNPAPPFTTSSLQQEASRKLGFSVRKTMSIAQRLYEGLDLGADGRVGLVSYIRTDSTRVAAEARAEGLAYVRETWGAAYAGDREAWAAKNESAKAARGAEAHEANAGRNVQGAHEAIRPTSSRRTPEGVKPHLSGDEYKLYKLIWERFIASLMAPAVLEAVSVDIRGGGELFRASGQAVRFPGFMAVYIEGRDDEAPGEGEAALPDLREGQELRLLSVEPRQHFTQPPPRYSEAMLVKALEERGIGRPSTYAPIIETIQARGYVEKVDRRFHPTDLGLLVLDLLKEYFPKIIDVEFTAEFEDKLDQVESGQLRWRDVLAEFYGPFSETLARAEAQIGSLEVPEEESDVACEKCGRRMVVKHGRFGRFLACPGFPACRNTKPLREETGVACPRCGGMIVERRSKKGRRFYGCNNYPACDFVVWQRPVGRACPRCGSFLVEKRGRQRGPHYACSNEACDYVELREPETVEVP